MARWRVRGIQGPAQVEIWRGRRQRSPNGNMRIDVITIFPEMFASPLECSILGRARAAGILEVCVHNLRDWTTDRHQVVDDYPYGGGGGMVLKPEPLFAAVEDLNQEEPRGSVVLLTPQGRTFDQAQAEELAKDIPGDHCLWTLRGRGWRVREALVDTELSSGLLATGGSSSAGVGDRGLPAAAGALGDEQAPRRIRLVPGCWSTHTTRGLRSSEAGKCQRYC